MSRDKERQRIVTDEPFRIGDDIKGLPLATVRRRAAAMFVDSVLCWFALLPFLIAIALGALYLRTPSMARGLIAISAGEELSEAADGRGKAEVILLVARQRPEVLPPLLAAAVEAEDLDAVIEILAGETLRLQVDPVDGSPSYFDPQDNTLHVHRDVFFGPYAGYVGAFAFIMVYFALVTWAGKGRTPGKWLFGLRVVRLDGEPLTFWDAFSRAGGYAGSASTFGLGFLEARWDPNRQALHDKVSRTVVLREPRGRIPAANSPEADD